MISTVCVPTDGSETSQKAGVYAVDMAKQPQASILVVSVIDKRFLVIRTVPVGKSFQGEVESLDVGHELAWELITTFLHAEFSGAERFLCRLTKVAAMEHKEVKS